MAYPMDQRAKYSLISIATPYDDSGDLEGATKTITNVAKPGVADYTDTNGLTGPNDNRLVVRNVGVRMTVDVDSFNAGCTTLNYSIDVGTEAALTGSFVAAGAGQLKVYNVAVASHAGHAGVAAGIYFWVDAGNAVISKVDLEIAYGVTSTTLTKVFDLPTNCLLDIAGRLMRSGTGTIYLSVSHAGGGWNAVLIAFNIADGSYIGSFGSQHLIIASSPCDLWMRGSVATDLVRLTCFSLSVMTL